MLHRQLNTSLVDLLGFCWKTFPENKHVGEVHQLMLELDRRFSTHPVNIFNILKKGILSEAARTGTTYHEVIDKVILIDRDTCDNLSWLQNICFLKMYDNAHLKKRNTGTKLKNKLGALCKHITVLFACGEHSSTFEQIAANITQNNVLPSPSTDPQGFCRAVGEAIAGYGDVVEGLVNDLDSEGKEDEIKRNLNTLLSSQGDQDINIDDVLSGLHQLVGKE